MEDIIAAGSAAAAASPGFTTQDGSIDLGDELDYDEEEPEEEKEEEEPAPTRKARRRRRRGQDQRAAHQVGVQGR